VAELVDWALARRIATLGLSDGRAAMRARHDLAATGERAGAAVLEYTGLEPVERPPAPQWINRADWVDLNLDSARELVALLTTRLGGAAERPPLAAAARSVLAFEIGGLLGFASRHVLGQYEYPLLGGARPPRLVFVGENIDNAAAGLGAEPGRVLDWIALHETTHAVQFASTPWLRPYIGERVRTLLAEGSVQFPVRELFDRARRIATTDPRRLYEELRSSDPVSLLAPAESVATINRIQAVMAAVEGYAEHVMDAAGEHLGPAVAELRAGLDARRRNRSLPVRLLSWLFGFELKLRQYEQGKRFCDTVVTSSGIAGLNAAWAGPESLPDLGEITAPEAWIARVLPAAAA